MLLGRGGHLGESPDCHDDCRAACLDGCLDDCRDGCLGGCLDDCLGGCLDDCLGDCLDACLDDCRDDCLGDCLDDCLGGCLDDCRDNCHCDRLQKTAHLLRNRLRPLDLRNIIHQGTLYTRPKRHLRHRADQTGPLPLQFDYTVRPKANETHVPPIRPKVRTDRFKTLLYPLFNCCT